MESSYLRCPQLLWVIAGMTAVAILIVLPAPLAFVLSASLAAAWCQRLDREGPSKHW